MKTLELGQIVRFRGKIYFVEDVLRSGLDPWYIVRSTALNHRSTVRTVIMHSEIEGMKWYNLPLWEVEHEHGHS